MFYYNELNYDNKNNSFVFIDFRFNHTQFLKIVSTIS